MTVMVLLLNCSLPKTGQRTLYMVAGALLWLAYGLSHPARGEVADLSLPLNILFFYCNFYCCWFQNSFLFSHSYCPVLCAGRSPMLRCCYLTLTSSIAPTTS